MTSLDASGDSVIRIVRYAEMSAEPIPFDCEHIGDSGLGWLISMKE